MIKAGLTGGIGSGKTTAARMLALLGIPVYDSDRSAKRLMARDPEVIRRIRELLGDAAYRNGAPDNAFIAERVFRDESLLTGLNNIVHPAVLKDYLKWTDAHRDAPCTVIESAILLESGFARYVDKIIVVTAPEEIRIRRCMVRDKADEEAIRRRIEAQMQEEERLRRADYVLHSDEKHLLIPQVLRLAGQLGGRAAE